MLIFQYFVFSVRLLCQLHRIDAAEIAAEWVAFAHTNKGYKISQETLDQLERDVGIFNEIMLEVIHLLNT